MKTERISFPGATGAILAARLDRPEGPVRAAAVLAHCFTCSKDIAAARRISGRLAALGIAVLRFDFTGLGHSGGEFANTNFSSNVGDLLAATRWMAGQGLAPQLLIGHSLGGAAVLKAAPQVPGLRAVVSIGAPSDPAHVAHNFGGKLDEIRAKGEAVVTLAGRDLTIRRQFLDDISAASLTDALPRLGAALLVLHAPRDSVVGIENAQAIFVAAKHPKSFVSLDDADHLLTREADAEYVADLISSWSSRYLDLAPEHMRPEAPEGVVRVAEAEASGFRQDITVNNRHQLVADEPVEMGGTDLGPSPYQLLSAALGACTAMTIRLYARRKGIPLAHVACDVTHDRCHTEDCEECDKAQSKVDVFNRTIHLRGDLSEDQRAALLAIADKCPVHKTLHGQAIIRSALAGD
ncbi:bifunctional alpha/beta hydrolase/OsmC family protein [Albidovulum sediminis]|uniref:Bifunctional alpha/beta hydrolase/OsmC family protein n=1 Tax=Albidovulum sediminis TaxID=3066345 RepID=A0ABT2NU91_9RHOB|nr:bifunctional alpha/beta hydrolase/OsmC family protein [Defluviimonas sediminis]MCT8331144.1 bifunctional alpha/beta hydrolase/OsmC family protein [Defluviimonas sediminis]